MAVYRERERKVVNGTSKFSLYQGLYCRLVFRFYSKRDEYRSGFSGYRILYYFLVETGFFIIFLWRGFHQKPPSNIVLTGQW